MASLDISRLLALLDTGEQVVLPNVRAAKDLRSRFDDRQRTLGSRAWEPASVFAWQEWLETLWSALTLDGSDDRILLNRLQEELLWIETIEGSTEGAHLTPGGLRELAALARSGLELAAAHTILPKLRATAESVDERAFANWQAAFLQRCDATRLLPRALLEKALEEHSKAGNLPLAGPVHLVGFDRLSPAQEAFLDRVGLAGCHVLSHGLVQPATEPPLRASVQLSDPREELRWAAAWVRDRFAQRRGSGYTIALLLPDPAAERSTLEPLLRAELAPELEAIGSDVSSTPWQFGAGPPLASLALIQHALFLLRWLLQDLPLESIGALLLSPFFKHTDSFEARARFEMHGLRRATLLRPELSLEHLLTLARHDQRRQALSFPELHAVRQLAGDPRLLSGSGSHADWTELIRKLLHAVGWPGPRTLSAAEYTATETLESVLDLLATLDVTGRRVTFTETVQQLEREVHKTPAPDTGVDAPLRIMRLEEAEGSTFDAVILLRATDRNLPSPERPHPLLSWNLQRSHGLPGVDPALTLAQSRSALESLGARCGDLLLLSAADDDTGPLRASPLGVDLAFQPLHPDALLAPRPQPTALQAEWVADTAPLPSLPSFQVSGGARLLELQAACGFRAFAEFRLGAAKPEGRALGLDARQSGTVLHRALEFFWNTVKTQAALRSFSTETRQELIERSVDHGFRPIRDRVPAEDIWNTRYLAVLEQRLRSLLDRWMEQELQRADFTVLPTEQEQSITVGPLHLNVRPDRIDGVEGGFVLIDYKTSYALSTNDWLGERPKAPQLPLYALLGDVNGDEFRGLAFARLRPGKDMAWLSLQDQPELFSAKRGAVHDIAGQVELWRAELDRLAVSFAAGETRVDPKSYPHTCQYCQQRLLCRLDAATLLSEATEPSESSQVTQATSDFGEPRIG